MKRELPRTYGKMLGNGAYVFRSEDTFIYKEEVDGLALLDEVVLPLTIREALPSVRDTLLRAGYWYTQIKTIPRWFACRQNTPYITGVEFRPLGYRGTSGVLVSFEPADPAQDVLLEDNAQRSHLPEVAPTLVRYFSEGDWPGCYALWCEWRDSVRAQAAARDRQMRWVMKHYQRTGLVGGQGYNWVDISVNSTTGSLQPGQVYSMPSDAAAHYKEAERQIAMGRAGQNAIPPAGVAGPTREQPSVEKLAAAGEQQATGVGKEDWQQYVPEDRWGLISLWRDGETARDIGEQLNLSPGRIRNMVTALRKHLVEAVGEDRAREYIPYHRM